MMSKRTNGMDTSVPPGKMILRQRQLLLDYLAENLGPKAQKRALMIDNDMPLDEGIKKELPDLKIR